MNQREWMTSRYLIFARPKQATWDYKNRSMSQCQCIKGKNTCRSRRIPTTSSILGRRTGSSFQQRVVMFQIGSLKFWSCGRLGRSPSMISETATGSVNSGNGCTPVKTLGRILYQVDDNPSTPDARWKKGRELTSMTTMPKE